MKTTGQITTPAATLSGFSWRIFVSRGNRMEYMIVSYREYTDETYMTQALSRQAARRVAKRHDIELVD